VASAEQHVFGACVLNDWSARDIQGWEYQPLGPFLGKNFATSISPWVVTMAALAPFRVPFTRGVDDPAPLPHLDLGAAAVNAAFDIQLDVCLASGRMRDDHLAGYRLARSNFRHAYWALAQMVAHHSSNGCNLRPGDLLGTGTISGPGPGELGSMLEVTHGGRDPVTLTTGEPRRFVEDGDSIIMRAWCERPGAKRIGFGTCTGTVLPALVSLRDDESNCYGGIDSPSRLDREAPDCLSYDGLSVGPGTFPDEPASAPRH
jgi:fumarylacetoacetase